MGGCKVAIIIPAYNEEDSIAQVVKSAVGHGQPIVVDDGSIDLTALIAINHGAIVVRHPVNKGYERALESGFQKAYELGFDILVTLDGDGQHNAGFIPKLVKLIKDGSMVAIGVRGNLQRCSETLFEVFFKNKYGIHDPLSGMKAYDANLYAGRGCFDIGNCSGVDLLAYAASRNYKISEILIETKPRLGDTKYGGAIKGNAKILFALMKIALRYRKQNA